MPIITVSRGSYSYGKQVAEKVAEKLGYECVSRDILIEASEEFNVPEIKLDRAIRHAPSCFEKFTFKKERYIAYIRAALLAHLAGDNVVYHGLAGHYFVTGVAHVLKVRILAEEEDRVRLVMEREGISRDKALHYLQVVDEARRQWGLQLYGIDTNNPRLYDLVLHIKKFSADDAAEVICLAAGMHCFQPTPESQKAIDDLLLAARIKAALIDHHPRANVKADGGAVYIGLEGASSRDREKIQQIVARFPEVKNLDLNVEPFMVPD